MRTHRPRAAWLLAPLALAIVLGARADDDPPPAPSPAEEPPGARIYRESCASCHGARGEGNIEEYPHPLAGEKPLEALTKQVARTMPVDDPGSLSDADAAAVSSFIYDSFYSIAARERNRPHLALARLTVRQHRHALADLVGTFREAPRPDARQGLNATYRKGRKERGEAALERLDSEVMFDFGTNAAVPEIDDPYAFSIRWEGTVAAPETGEYEFNVRSDQAVRLWVNDRETPIVDAWVQSGSDLDHRGTVRLLAGRAYPIRLEFSKATQGVQDQDKSRQKPPAPAQVALWWTPPGRAPEVVPRHALSPGFAPELFVASTPFPPDDRSAGYERGTSVSPEWLRAATDAALETSAYVADHLDALAGTKPDAPDRAEKLKAFCRRLAERAARRPLDDEAAARLVDRQFAEAADPVLAVKRSVLLTLTSPRFLYQPPAGGDGHDVAARLALALTDSLPDEELLSAAASGALADRDQVAAHARRLLDDPRTRSKLHEHLRGWLRVAAMPDLSKDPAAVPGFEPSIASDLRTSLDLFLDDVLWGDPQSADFRRLLLDDTLFLNGRLAAYYGADLPPDAPFQKTRLTQGERAGVVTHPYLMASFAYTASSSPIHRGVFLARGVLGRALRPPPIAVAPLAPDLAPDLTTRQRVATQTSPDACRACHDLINPLGFALEHYDAVGRWRDEEKGHPVDATGQYTPIGGEAVSFADATELARTLADSPEVQAAFVSQLVHAVAKQPADAYGLDVAPKLRQTFADHSFNIRDLLVEVATTAAQ